MLFSRSRKVCEFMKNMYKCATSLLLSVVLAFALATPAMAAPNSNYTLTGNGANDIVSVALAQKGIGGDSGGSAFGFPAKYSWCAYFACWAGRTAGANFPKSNLGTPRDVARWFVNINAGTFYYFRDANYQNLLSSGTVKNTNLCVKSDRNSFSPQKGDLICFLWSNHKASGYNWSHIGIVTANYSGNGYVATVEGNAGATNAYNGKVGTYNRAYDSQVIGIIRPNYSGSGSTTPGTPKSTTLTSSTSSITLDLLKNKSQTITLTLGGYLPENCKLYASSSNPNVASNSWGNYVQGLTVNTIISGQSVGTSTIKYSIVDGDTQKTLATKSVKVTVTAPTLTIKYNANGGTVSSSQYRAASSGAIQKGSADLAASWPYGYGHENGLYNDSTLGLTRPGYSFVGWSLSKDGSTRVFGQDEKVQAQTIYPNLKNGSATVTLYAVWKADSTTLSANPSSLTLDLSNKSSQKITLTLGGYLQDKWEIHPSRSNPDVVTSEWDAYSGGTTVQAIITGKSVGTSTITYSIVDVDTETTLATTSIKVTVTAPTYTIRYDANGGSGAPATQAKVYQKALTLSSNRPTRTGYTFSGWATSSNGPVQYQPGGQYTANQNATLYAVWSPQNTVALTLEKSSFRVEAWDKFALNFSYTGDVNKVTYDIGNENICIFGYTDSTSKQNDATNISTVFKARSAGTTSIAINLLNEKGEVIVSKTASVTVEERTAPPILTGYRSNLGISSLEVGETHVFWIKGDYSDGTVRDVTSLCKASSSDTNILEVNGHTISAKNVGTAQLFITYPDGLTTPKTISVVAAPEEKEQLWISFDQSEYTCYSDVPADEYHLNYFTLGYSTNATDATYRWSISDISLLLMAWPDRYTNTSSSEIRPRYDKVGDATVNVTITQDGQTATASCKIHVREQQDRQNVIDMRIYYGAYPHLQVSFRYHPMNYSISIASIQTGETVWEIESSHWLGLEGEGYGNLWDISSLPSGNYRATATATNSFGTVTTEVLDFTI